MRLQRSTSCRVLTTINANPFRKFKPRFRVALAAPSPQVAAHFRGLVSSMLRDPCTDFPRDEITLRAHKTTDQKLLNVSPRSRTEAECLMNVRFHCLRSEYRHRPCEVVHRKVQTALCPLLCMAGFRFSLFFVNANSWFGPYPIVGSNARYLYQTNLNVNAILA